MEISGLRESNELMKISAADISALEYHEQHDLAVMCVTPNNTMESLFEESVFDPSCDDKSRCLIYLCWNIESKSDKTAFLRLQEYFDKDVAISALSMATFQKYASEFTKPASIDLISSDDDGGGNDDDDTANNKKIADDHGPNIPHGARDASIATSTNKGLVVRKSQYWSSVNSNSVDPYLTSIGQRTRGKNKETGDDSLWRDPSLLSGSPLRSKAARRATTPSWFASETGSYDLRKTKPINMAELSSSNEDVNNSGSDDDDFVVQFKRVGTDVSGLKFEYSLGGSKPISVVGSDISRLFRGEFLNDTIIEFYMRYIGENLRSTNAKLYERCFFFNTFFFKKLSQRSRAMTSFSNNGNGNDDPMCLVYNQLKKWTASVDLFDKDYIFVPINENIHWYLAIVANPRALLSSKAEAPDGGLGGSDAEALGSPKRECPADSTALLSLPISSLEAGGLVQEESTDH
ncbi:hypothetical protein GGI21_003207, partial [Coemansia aciculifera]